MPGCHRRPRRPREVCPTNPGTLAAGVPAVGSPVKKYPARENPTRAVLTTLGENTCVSSRLKTCSRSVMQIGSEQVERRRGHAAAVVDGVRRHRRIFARKYVVHARGSKIFPNILQRTAEILCDSSRSIVWPFAIGHRFRSDVTSRAQAACSAAGHPNRAVRTFRCGRCASGTRSRMVSCRFWRNPS